MNLQLKELSLEDEKQFLTANSAFAESDFTFAIGYDSTQPFAAYVEYLKKIKEGTDLPPKFVPATMFCAWGDGQIVGRVSIRHKLNEYLAKVGGHVGYGVVPAFRRKGYATEILRQTLPYAKKLGLSRILVTCDEGNIGSQKTIERCGGIFESLVHAKSEQVATRRYWIDL